MGKINKYANIYDKEGNLIRKVDEKDGVLKNYTIEELEKLVDELTNDRDENGNIKDPQTLNNVNMVLMQMYSTKKGQTRLQQLLEELKAKQSEKPTEEQAVEALNKLKEELENNGTEEPIEPVEDPKEIVSQVESNLDEEYVEFEESAPENND